MTGFGDSGSAARFFHHFPPDADPLFYHAKAGKLDRANSKHPTVKPIALMQYLIRHITPPGGVVLDPFAGSGTTAEAAKREGFDCILMEAEPEYLDFLRQRFDLRNDEQDFGDCDDLADLLGTPETCDDLADLLGGTA
ncbi:DNA methyltransferase [Plastorhodobacter daqingensis]|uniref:site-specific DNA-methyltransferase (adenine-specific) n=1 Tax=Plastorhodobacter daqingensis TaxID=1387281 RepID=A0ABW2UJI0_9RHOB